MKKLFYLFLALPILFACDADDPETTDDLNKTSYVISIPDSPSFERILTGYYDKEGKCRLICDHGNWTQGGKTPEFILPEYHEVIYIYFWSEEWGYYIFDRTYWLYENRKSYFTVPLKAFPIPEPDEYNWPH